jgi:hypothetical protein
MNKLKEFFNYYSSNHAYTEYSFLKTLIWKTGVLRRFFGDLRSGKKEIHINLEKLNKRHKLIEKPSYEGLPEVLKKNKNTFDFIFIDGWHTFDYTLVDFFYSNLLLKVGGTIIIDDALHNGVSAFVKYLDTNYKFYKKIESHETIVIYEKIKEDDRPWNYHVSF